MKRLLCIAFALLSTLIAGDAGGLLKNAGLRPILRHRAPTAKVDGQGELPAGLSVVDWKQIKAESERHRHGMEADGKGGYQSRSQHSSCRPLLPSHFHCIGPSDTKLW